MLAAAGGRRGAPNLPLPTSAYQVRPLLFLLDHLRRDADTLKAKASNTSYDDRRAAVVRVKS